MTTPLPAPQSKNWYSWAQWLDGAVRNGAGYTDEQVRDVVAAMVRAGANVTITNDDTANTLTIASSGGSGIVADATTTVKGVVQLAGDLGGTAAAPTVPAIQSASYDDGANTLVKRDPAGNTTLNVLTLAQQTPDLPNVAARKDYVDNGLAAKVTAVNHGSTAGTARPAGAVSVTWIGSVEPTNMTDADLWIAPA